MVLHRIKTFAERIPEPIGKIFAGVPYSMRLGSVYSKKKRLIDQFSSLDTIEQKDWILFQIRELVTWATCDHPFYHSFYDDLHYDPRYLKEFSDIKDIPIVTRDDLQRVPLEKRATNEKDRYLTNTGGSSGKCVKYFTGAL